ncbi:MAG TPA: SOS response-associated peptidase [Casimicrobiaceae bacterium]|nr:SOS response-associated peptidase [Casimicrobiaceae bacterium]
MCGRYELHSHPAAIALAFGLRYPPEIHARFNIAPTQSVPIIRQNTLGERELVQVKWGLVPRWAKDPSIGTKLINARSESVADKPAFRMAFARHRCLLPADGFYEWQQCADGNKKPIRVAMADGSSFGLAGLYERWLSPEGEPLDTCTILTTEANALLRGVHSRMPLIIPPEQYATWLDPTTEDVQSIVAPFPAEAMMITPVSRRVNNVKNDDAALIEPLSPDEAASDSEPMQAELPVEVSDDEAVEEPVQSQLF